MNHSFSRRDFLKASALTGAGLFVNPGTVRASRSVNEKLNIAAVGSQNRAFANIKGCMDENIVALCDIDSKLLGQAAEVLPPLASIVTSESCLSRKKARSMPCSSELPTTATPPPRRWRCG